MYAYIYIYINIEIQIKQAFADRSEGNYISSVVMYINVNAYDAYSLLFSINYKDDF